MKILAFAPHSAIWVHALPEALVLEALKQAGHEIIYVTCGKLFATHCVAMSASGVGYDDAPERKKAVCERCVNNANLLRTGVSFDGPWLRGLIADEDVRTVDGLLADENRDTLLDLERDGVPLGRIALYQLMIRNKMLDLKFGQQAWHEYLVDLRYTLYSWLATGRLIDTHRPDRVIVYNGLYSVNRAACLAAEARGIPAYFLHAGVNLSNRLQTMMVGRGHTFTYYPKLLGRWPQFAALPATPRMLSLVTNHYLALFGGRSIFVYSKEKSTDVFDPRRYFGIAAGQKVLVATLGTYDEEVAAEAVGARKYRQRPLFETQIEWVRALVEFVAGRPNLFLIVRVHPREFPNRREGRKSQHASLLEAEFSRLPPNAAVNWPSDGISLFDLADKADVFLNSWSSVGKDMALLGIPVVIYSDEVPFYPIELNYIGTTLESYFSAIDAALKDGWSAETVRRAYRWSAYEFIRSTVDIGDGYKEEEARWKSVV